MRIRSATPADIPAMLALELECVSAAHWTEPQYRDIVQPSDSSHPQRLALVADSEAIDPVQRGLHGNPALLGFLVALHVGPEWELENIVVAPSTRRTGLGTRLMGELFARARQTKSESVLLEVRASNFVACALYEKCGFQEVGRRPAYYRNPREDAVLLRRSLR